VKLLIRPAAAADIEDGYRWYRNKRQELGLEFLAAVRAGIRRILEMPNTYPVLHRNTRRIRLKRFPYSLYYRVYPDTIILVACMHGKRDPKRWRQRG
jgi:plasmid stabilization system protein ParE